MEVVCHLFHVDRWEYVQTYQYMYLHLPLPVNSSEAFWMIWEEEGFLCLRQPTEISIVKLFSFQAVAADFKNESAGSLTNAVNRHLQDANERKSKGDDNWYVWLGVIAFSISFMAHQRLMMMRIIARIIVRMMMINMVTIYSESRAHIKQTPSITISGHQLKSQNFLLAFTEADTSIEYPVLTIKNCMLRSLGGHFCDVDRTHKQ